jgi:hypothetical protein
MVNDSGDRRSVAEDIAFAFLLDADPATLGDDRDIVIEPDVGEAGVGGIDTRVKNGDAHPFTTAFLQGVVDLIRGDPRVAHVL